MVRSPRAVLLTGNVLCNNPRVIKEADTLAEAGWDVEVLGAWVTTEFMERDRELVANRPWRFTPVIEPTASSWPRLRARVAREVGTRLGWQSRWQLGYAASELLAAALPREADIYVAHSEQALWVAHQLARRGRRIGVDFEDWFSRDHGADARPARAEAIIEDLERAVIRVASTRTCPSYAMSTALGSAYASGTPTVVYNAFPWSDRARLDGRRCDRTSSVRPSILWYSQTIGPGRGLEVLCAALAEVDDDAEVHVRGTGNDAYKARLHASLPERWQTRLFFHSPVSNDELSSRIAEHDIGFSCEDATAPSRDLTITNKMLHGLVAGLAMVASDTAGTREVASMAPGAIQIFDASRPSTLAACLRLLLRNPVALAAARTAALDAAHRTFSWERQQSVLRDLFARAVAGAHSA